MYNEMEPEVIKHILAIGTNIGDVELSCGKTLATHAIKGDRITIVAMTAGERSAPSDRSTDEFKQYNIDCATNFAKALGGDFICLDYPDGEVPESREVSYRICDLIREIRPDVVLTHWAKGLSESHVATTVAVDEGVTYASRPKPERFNSKKEPLMPHWARGPYYAENWGDADGFEPHIYIDVTKGYDLWNKNIDKIWIISNSPKYKYHGYFDALSRSRGAIVRVERAECYSIQSQSKGILHEGF